MSEQTENVLKFGFTVFPSIIFKSGCTIAKCIYFLTAPGFCVSREFGKIHTEKEIKKTNYQS